MCIRDSYIPVRAKIFHTAGLSWEPALSDSQSVYAEADRAICGRGNLILRLSHQKHRLSVADWKALSEPQRQRVRNAVFSLACEGVAGMQQSTSTDGSLPSCTVQMLALCWHELHVAWLFIAEFVINRDCWVDWQHIYFHCRIVKWCLLIYN